MNEEERTLLALVGVLIRQGRETIDATVDDMALKIGVSARTWRNIEDAVCEAGFLKVVRALEAVGVPFELG